MQKYVRNRDRHTPPSNPVLLSFPTNGTCYKVTRIVVCYYSNNGRGLSRLKTPFVHSLLRLPPPNKRATKALNRDKSSGGTRRKGGRKGGRRGWGEGGGGWRHWAASTGMDYKTIREYGMNGNAGKGMNTK